MKKLSNIFYFLILSTNLLFALEYTYNYAETDFYKGKFDKIVRFDVIYFSNSFADEHLSKKLHPIIQKIKEELANPHASLKVSIVGYSEHRNSQEEALQASKQYIERVYKKLLAGGVDKSSIYTYAQADDVMLYSDETEESNALSNWVNINLYLSYLSDEDKDGVYSDKDKCPNSPQDAIVDANGCNAKNIVVLVEGHKKGAKIIVSNDAGSVTIDTFNELTLMNSKKSAPTPPKKISQKKLERAFADLVGVDVIYKHYIFYFDDINLLENSKKELNNMIIEIAKIKDPIIKIIGHTDTVGSSRYNVVLGLKRANEIKKFILKSKIKALKIDALSYGEKNLAVKTADNVDEKLNRRVEVFIH
ncbi:MULTISPECIES: OmpA family protein [Sulfurimonas]|uniref:OmpA family protein n=1 Tax=Sulfurimonas TaxID=202746 RepID=UPI0012645819|nr:OmpA family protein [Sulfurimonas indica]